MNDRLQWHPAFYASMQIELEEERENLIFENEHQLGTKPKEIDVLIVKKESSVPVRKNIGRIFRKHNIIEYKSPEDSLRVDDYYKVYVRANYQKFEEVSGMCKALEELMQPYIREQVEAGIEKGRQEVMEQGIHQGESRVNRLNSMLMETGRTHDIFKAMADVEYQKKLFLEFNI